MFVGIIQGCRDTGRYSTEKLSPILPEVQAGKFD